MSKEAFALEYQGVADKAGAVLGVNPNALIAQWGLETGWGKSIIPGTNNLGNIKDFSGKGTSAVDNATGSVDKYRTYASLDEFADDYVSLIKRRYPKAVGQKTAQGYAAELKAAGYAEDPEYVQKITQIAGEDFKAAPVKVSYPTAIEAAIQGSIMRPKSRAAFDASLQQAQFERQVQEEGRPTVFEQFGAAVAGNTDSRLIGGIVDALWGDEFAAAPGYTPDIQALPIGADSTLIEDYVTATSPGAAQKVLTEWEQEQTRRGAMGDDGMLKGFALGLAGELTSVTNWVAPFAVAKTMAAMGTGSLALAQQGRAMSSIGSAITENVLSGTVIEAAAQSMEGRFNGQDLLVSLVADSLLGAVADGLGVMATRPAEELIDRAAIVATERQLDLATRAEAQLGAHSSTSQLRQVMEDIEKQDVTEVVKTALADAPTNRKLIVEEPAIQNDLQASTRYAAPDATAEEARISAMDNRWATLRRIGLDLPDDNTAAGRAKAIADLDATPKTHIAANAKSSLRFAQYAEAIESLRKQLLPDVAIHLTDGKAHLKGTNLGAHAAIKPGVSAITLRADSGMAAAVHEFGHAVFAHKLASLPPAKQEEMFKAWQDWRDLYITAGKADEAMLRRSPIGTAERRLPDGTETFAGEAANGKFKEALIDVWDQAFPNQKDADKFAQYFANFDEYSAEQFAKYVESQVAGEGAAKLTVPQQIIAAIAYVLKLAAEIFNVAKAKNIVKPDAPFLEFFEDLIDGNQAKGLVPLEVSELQLMATPARSQAVVGELMTDPALAQFGMTGVPVGTAAERKQAQAMLALHKKAAAWEAANPMDEAYLKRVQNLADNNVFNVASNGLLMLKSKNPLTRMIASELLEDASGAAGKRRDTAAISKYLTERLILGNSLNDVQGAYAFWKKGKPGGLRDDLVGGANWDKFNKEIASEIEARRLTGAPVTQDANVKAAADSLEAAYQRAANSQRSAGTLGAEGLPTTSVGYMPHRMSPKSVFNLSNEQRQILHNALIDQFITIEGWDASFSDTLASSYIKRVRDRAAGGYGSNVGGGNPGTNSLVEEALRGMDLPEDVIKQHMDKFSKGAANFTKGRIELDLNKVYTTAEGNFKLIDIFETNQIELLRSQAGRASGEVALTKYGVRGKPGLQLLRDSLGYGADSKRTEPREFDAFDQMAAEFMNEPFGTASGKFMERAMSANTLVRLGGIAFNQLAESINGIAHVGALRVMSSLASIPRLRAEIKDLVAGKKVDNPFLTSIEASGGAEFGTDAYKVVMPFDSPDHAYPTYGQDTLTLTDRLLRGGGYLQSKLSGWRMIHSAQQRGMAEQIVKKVMRYVNEGKDDIALQQMGITAEMQAVLRAELPNIASFDANGSPLRLEVNLISDASVREQLIQAVWRGTSQIIQGTFIGERGKWAHDGWLKMMTQFRTFSLTSMEKQWGRQRNSRGGAAAFGMLMGTMSIAAPIYMARVYANSIGRPDQEEYINQRLEPAMIARATLNYVAMSGLSGDFIDLLSSTLPEELGVKPTGGRSGVESDFVGNYVLPASSLVNDIWKYAQSPLEIDDAARIMPMSRVPYIVPFMNGLRED